MCIFKSKKVSTPDTSVQEAEAARQRQLEEQRYRERLDAENARWEQQRADEERRYQEQFAQQTSEAERQRLAMQAEIDRQLAETQRVEAMREAERQEQLAQVQARAAQSRAYVEGRQKLITDAETSVNDAYAGFDDAYFQKFADSFVQQHAPQLEREAAEQTRAAAMQGVRKGNFKSTAQAREQGKLALKKTAAQGQLAAQGQDAAQSFRTNIDGQKRDALSAIWSAGAVGSENLPDGITDANAALGGIGQQLGSLTQTARNRAATVSNPFF